MFESRASASLASWAGILLFRYLLSDYSGLHEARARARDIDGADDGEDGGRAGERILKSSVRGPTYTRGITFSLPRVALNYQGPSDKM